MSYTTEETAISGDPWDEIPFGTDADEMAPVEDAAVLAAMRAEVPVQGTTAAIARAYFR